MLIVTSIGKTAAACALGACLALAAAGQAAFAQADAPTPLATGMIDTGSAEGQVIEAVRNGDILSIKIRFKPIVPGKTEMVYTSISKNDYENSFYVVAGNKKYLLLKDSNDKPLTNPKLVIRTSKEAPIAGSWQGKFPAPPKDIAEVSLTIPGVETFDAIKISDR
ncbi:hypothetical protein WHX56_22150 [Achromobacter veterisilvae]|uniref:DUF4384 domain-containing protein n=1 Tax=Achromobacter veterisilvae TaxID=2069367 RepID=A0ABZ2RV62_9BURK